MITLQQYLELINYRITEGSDYGWHCYGDNAHMLSSWNGEYGDGGWSANIVFDTQTQEVYEVEVCDYTNDRAYRMINPEYLGDYKAEVKSRGEFADHAWDDVDYTDLDVQADFVQKFTAIVAGEKYDDRVQVQVDFTDEELLKYMKIAHERDITFNQLIEDALRCAVDKYMPHAADTE